MRALLTAILLPSLGAAAGRITISLDGVWSVAEGVAPDQIPASFPHTVKVPGLTNQAQPAFADVDQFESRELIDRNVRHKLWPETRRTKEIGLTRQKRNYFWHRRTFRAPARRQTAILKINKAQFGVGVWLNGRKIGEHWNPFAAGFFVLSDAIKWDADNTLVVRIGAHPGMIPVEYAAGTDFEKLKWTPGIYDSVSLLVSDNPVIESIQAAPRIKESKVVVQAVLRNYGAAASVRLSHRVRPWKGGAEVGSAGRQVALKAGESQTVTMEVPIRSPHLWTPEDPFLYVLESSTGGDSATTRFGMREFRFDTVTRRAYLNDKVYFLRGSNITLHRFFEDPKAGGLVWDEKWVRKLLAEIPKKMHWNSFRFCIGPAPDFWFDVADEAGLLIQNEFFIWTGGETWSSWHNEWTERALLQQYREWMRDHWNHPSVAIWDASNETASTLLAEKIVPAVRELDLSNRPWENGYSVPSGPDDPVEDHPYLFSGLFSDRKPEFRMTDLERMTGGKTANAGHPTGHAAFINEYGWLWVNRDGTPTELTKKVYEKLLGPTATAAEIIETNNYLLGGLTEFWRAHRNFAGVLHFVYLTCSYPGVFTSDHFRDVEKLELYPQFLDYVGEAFKPLGVYINFWQPRLAPGARRRIDVMMVNDEQAPAAGDLVLSIGGIERTRKYSLPPLGAHTYSFELEAPAAEGEYLMKATARPGGGKESTVSRRKVTVTGKR